MASKLDITEVKRVEVLEGRNMIVHAVCAVRGDVAIRMGEFEARWLYVSLADKVRPWIEADDDEAEEQDVELSEAQEMTLRTIAANGGEMDGYAGQTGFRTVSLAPLIRMGLLEELGTVLKPGGGYETYHRTRITPAGWKRLGK